MTQLAVDICVVGAGPAGSVFASRMAQLGFDVCLVERARFPRRRLGESLSPGVWPMLSVIGAQHDVDAAGFTRVREVATNWEGPNITRIDPGEQGRLVDRGAFDTLLLGRARSLEVRVLQPASVADQEPGPDGWRIAVDHEGTRVEIFARFLADATGRSALLGGRRRRTGPRTIAIHAYWTGDRLPSQPRIEAGEREWYWGVPIPDGTYNTLAFVDGDRFRREPAMSLEQRMRALLARSGLMAECEGATLIAAPRAADATPYVDDDCISDRHIKVGDAALALDPLSSSGVQKAIQTSLAGAIVVNTMLRLPAMNAAAMRFYRNNLLEASDRHRAWAAEHYATAARVRTDEFWSARASAVAPAATPPAPPLDVPADARVQLSRQAEWVDTPCLGAQFVEVKPALRHPRLQSPVAYLGGWELAPLLRHVTEAMTPLELAQAWSARMPVRTGLTIANWLVSHGLLVPGDRAAELMA